MEPSDLKEDPEALEEFKERLTPIMGDLLDHPSDQISDTPSTPWMDVTIASWQHESGGKEYVLLDHAVLDD